MIKLGFWLAASVGPGLAEPSRACQRWNSDIVILLLAGKPSDGRKVGRGFRLTTQPRNRRKQGCKTETVGGTESFKVILINIFL